MGPRKISFVIKSFEELKKVLVTKSLPEYHPNTFETPEDQLSSEAEENLFRNAMDGVKPIPRKEYVEKRLKIEFTGNDKKKEDAETLERLEELIQYGKGFRVADTPEYIEGTGYQVHPEMAKRLHRGDFSIQAHLDLHGLIVEEAREIFDQFMKWAVTHGKYGLLVTHGRGLSSPVEPVLKKKVEEWLTRGPWRKWIVAYSSARRCDGGAGATYILLRPRSVSKRLKKKRIGGEKS